MTAVNDAFWRDANHVPITDGGLTAYTSKTLTANNATATVPIFGVTGSVLIRRIYGIITTALGNNHTTVYFRLNDQTIQTAITLATGSTASSFTVGSMLEKRDLVTVAIDVNNASTGVFEDGGGKDLPYYQEFRITQKTGGVATNIEYVYSTTNTPTSGAIKFYCTYIPLSDDGAVIAL